MICGTCDMPIREASFSPDGFVENVDGMNCVDHYGDALLDLFLVIAKAAGRETAY